MKWYAERKTKKAENFIRDLQMLCEKHKVQIMATDGKMGMFAIYDEQIGQPHIDCLIEDCTIGSNPE
jgi:hypothetical protein